MLLYLFEVSGHLFMHYSLKVLPQNFNQVEVWTLPEPVLHLNSFN